MASAGAALAAAAASAGSAEYHSADVCCEGPRAVGWQLSVLWPDDQQMYLGKVTAWCSKHNFHLVTYSDGEPLARSSMPCELRCILLSPGLLAGRVPLLIYARPSHVQSSPDQPGSRQSACSIHHLSNTAQPGGEVDLKHDLFHRRWPALGHICVCSVCASDFVSLLCVGQAETLDLNEEVVQWHQAAEPSQKRVLPKKGAVRAQRAPHRATAAALASPVATRHNALVVAGELTCRSPPVTPAALAHRHTQLVACSHQPGGAEQPGRKQPPYSAPHTWLASHAVLQVVLTASCLREVA